MPIKWPINLYNGVQIVQIYICNHSSALAWFQGFRKVGHCQNLTVRQLTGMCLISLNFMGRAYFRQSCISVKTLHENIEAFSTKSIEHISVVTNSFFRVTTEQKTELFTKE